MKASSTVQEALEQVKDSIGFARFELVNPSPAAQESLARFPGAGEMCRVMLNRNRSGSAFSSMWEFAAIAGFVETADGLKAMVVFTEREADDGNYDWAFVPITSLRAYKPERVRELKLSRT
jgi:hypothetical protein